MEERIKTLAETFSMKYHSRNKQISKRDKRSSVSLIRYADDFVIIHEDVNAVQKCREVISEFLLDMGLELKPSKTRLVHTLQDFDGEKPGFDFLGFNIRQYKAGKHSSGRNGHKEILGYKTIIKPSQDSTKKHYYKLKKVIEKSKGISQSVLINILNPIIRGYCNYFRTVSSSQNFCKLEALVFWKLWRWAICRHPNKGRKWIKEKYWKSIANRNWVFSIQGKDKPLKLFGHSEMKIVNYVKVKGNSSPYDGNLIYWSIRLGQNPEMPTRVAKLLKKQQGKCSHCGLVFKDGDVMEIDHIVPKTKGGKDTYDNFQLLHRHCHDKKTSSDRW
ncbi:MAG: HNH endonuclease [Scytonematopsis contorta HA4267-MV1]|nr:HNH endonuclease [Scytonematopsis contorta HA4267-MV1]